MSWKSTTQSIRIRLIKRSVNTSCLSYHCHTKKGHSPLPMNGSMRVAQESNETREVVLTTLREGYLFRDLRRQLRR